MDLVIKAAPSNKPKSGKPPKLSQMTGKPTGSLKAGPSAPAAAPIHAHKPAKKETIGSGTEVALHIYSNLNDIFARYTLTQVTPRLVEIANMPKRDPTPSTSGPSAALSANVSAGPAAVLSKGNKGKGKATVRD